MRETHRFRIMDPARRGQRPVEHAIEAPSADIAASHVCIWARSQGFGPDSLVFRFTPHGWLEASRVGKGGPAVAPDPPYVDYDGHPFDDDEEPGT